MASSGIKLEPDASGKRPMDELLDPLRPARLAAEQAEESARSSPTSAAYLYTNAAKSWIKAESPDRATAALKNASQALKRSNRGGAEHEHSGIADLYRQLELGQEAIEHWMLAIDRSQSVHAITGHQMKVNAMLSEDSSLKLTEQDRERLDPKYPFRAMARDAESKDSRDPSSIARYLIQAVEYWAKAEEKEDIQRVGVKAEAALKRVASNEAYHSTAERHYESLTEIYLQADLPERALACFVGAMKTARRDDDAVKHYKQIEQLCSEHGLPKPELDPETKAKLDPLNRYRVAARQYQERAETSSTESSRMIHWMQAAKSWLQAEETEEALKAAKQHAALLAKKDRPSQYEFTSLGEFFQKCNENELAMKAYEQALKLSTSDSQKRRVQEKINALD